MKLDAVRSAVSAMGARRVQLAGLAVAIFVAIALSGDVPPHMVEHAALLHPFRDARLFVDRDTAAAKWQADHQAPWLDRITRNPQARWLTGPRDLEGLSEVARTAEQRRELLVLVAYYVPNRDCGGPYSGAGTNGDYAAFIDGLIAALGSAHAAIVVEPDAVAAECFDHNRAALLRQTVMRLAAAGHYVYLDAGHPSWRPPVEMARRLRTAGIAYAEGFSVNVANRQTTKDSYNWARKISRNVGNREFVIDTSRNGVGPPTGPHSYSADWCNSVHQALGEEPTTATNRPGLAALLWIKPPGESDGQCGGEVDNGFSPGQAEELVRNAPTR
jgi:endoglucanase